jgi:hypothetical protein
MPEPDKTTKADPKGDSLREKLTLTILGFMLTGVVGGALTTWIQQRAWAWQNRVGGIEKDVNAVNSANKAASELINLRWRAAYTMTRALEREETGEAWKQARNEFDEADKQWALQYSNIARDVEFNVDGPFGVTSDDLSKVWVVDCAAAKSVMPFETNSARVVLEIINHCQGQTKSLIEPLFDAPAEERRMTKANREKIDAAYRRIDRIYRLNDVLRCVIFDRAVAIRNAQGQESYWGNFFGVAPAHYQGGRPISACAK